MPSRRLPSVAVVGILFGVPSVFGFWNAIWCVVEYLRAPPEPWRNGLLRGALFGLFLAAPFTLAPAAAALAAGDRLTSRTWWLMHAPALIIAAIFLAVIARRYIGFLVAAA
jgi:hypothetical protein